MKTRDQNKKSKIPAGRLIGLQGFKGPRSEEGRTFPDRLTTPG